MQLLAQQEQVKDFFNRISSGYAEKYSAGKPFHQWYFTERLHAATGDNPALFSGKKILDIGTGTGALYDYLEYAGCNLTNFAGCDIAEQMMANSRIPAIQRFTGQCYESEFPQKSFDHIFMLGVTTYIRKEEIGQSLNFIAEHLPTGGELTITFTNRRSLNSLMYRLISPFRFLLRKKNSVAGQSFKTIQYSDKEAKQLLNRYHLRVEKNIFINQTIFPFSHLFPKASVRLAGFLQKKLSRSGWLGFFSAEFLLKAVPENDA